MRGQSLSDSDSDWNFFLLASKLLIEGSRLVSTMKFLWLYVVLLIYYTKEIVNYVYMYVYWTFDYGVEIPGP